jgi:hypothetical protein
MCCHTYAYTRVCLVCGRCVWEWLRENMCVYRSNWACLSFFCSFVVFWVLKTFTGSS